MEFQKRLKKVMDEREVSQSALARAVGVSKSTISKYMNSPGKNHDAMTVLAIAKFLDVNSEWLYGVTDTRKAFYEPSFTDIYEKLSELGKREVEDFALFVLDRESRGKGDK